METNRVAAVLALAILAGCDAPPPVRVDTPLTRVEVGEESGSPPRLSPGAFLREWSRALRSGSVDGLIAFYDDSDDVVAIQSTGKARRGPLEIRRKVESMFEEVVFESASLESLSIRQRGDVAWANARFRAATRREQDESEWQLEVFASFVLQRSGDSWKIVLEHLSPIEGVPRVRPRG